MKKISVLSVITSACLLLIIGYYYGLSKGGASTIRNICARVILKNGFIYSNVSVLCSDFLTSEWGVMFLRMFFYSEIPLPFPNSSYLLEPSNPMANAEMRFLRLYNNLNQAIGLQ